MEGVQNDRTPSTVRLGMNTNYLRILATGLIVTACAPPRSLPTGVAHTTNWMVTEFGEHRSQDGVWKVSVSAADATLRLTRGQFLDHVATTNGDGNVAFWTGALTNTYSTE